MHLLLTLFPRLVNTGTFANPHCIPANTVARGCPALSIELCQCDDLTLDAARRVVRSRNGRFASWQSRLQNTGLRTRDCGYSCAVAHVCAHSERNSVVGPSAEDVTTVPKGCLSSCTGCTPVLALLGHDSRGCVAAGARSCPGWSKRPAAGVNLKAQARESRQKLSTLCTCSPAASQVAVHALKHALKQSQARGMLGEQSLAAGLKFQARRLSQTQLTSQITVLLCTPYVRQTTEQSMPRRFGSLKAESWPLVAAAAGI